jgi:FAD dependent oxidoreductase TIGR03364
MSMKSERVIVIGAGIIGLAHAITAREAGHEVAVLERDGRPLGASVRNFGTIWPIGCVFGEEREQALFGVEKWREAAAAAGFWQRPTGSLSLAYREEAWAVLNEFQQGRDGFELLDAVAVKRRFPAANPAGLRGALFSSAETVIHPPSALPALVDHARRLGVAVHFGTPVVKVFEESVEIAGGHRLPFDRLVIAAGEEMRLFFPEEIAAAEIHPCRLQMMRTVPQPANFDLRSILVSDLTLCHYPAFRDCPSAAALRARLEAELPEHHRWGVHVIAAQHHDGTLTLGDSHEYGQDLAPDSRVELDELILGALQDFAIIPDLRIAARWQGTYLKSKIGRTQVVLRPSEQVTLVTAMGGLGMTLSWGLARKTIASWQE